jgi:tRNA (guanine6-N2)-methyltransferase
MGTGYGWPTPQGVPGMLRPDDGLEVTTIPGLEDVMSASLESASGVSLSAELRPDGMAGHVRVGSASAELVACARSLAMAQRVVRGLATLELPGTGGLAEIRAAAGEVTRDLPELGREDAAFRVRCKRSGNHDFGSEDVEREAGAGVRDARIRPVRLKGPAVVVRCDVRGSTVRFGVEVPAAERPELPWRPTTSLKPQLAAGLLALARAPGSPAPRAVLDPFCGGGTILVEAAARWPEVELFGSDLHVACAEGVARNLAFIGAKDRSSVKVGDARSLVDVWPGERFDLMVTNPPFGKRLGREVDVESMYRSFLRAAATCAASDARLVVLALRRGAFNRALRDSGWTTRHVRIVELGGLYAGAFVLSPCDPAVAAEASHGARTGHQQVLEPGAAAPTGDDRRSPR